MSILLNRLDHKLVPSSIKKSFSVGAGFWAISLVFAGCAGQLPPPGGPPDVVPPRVVAAVPDSNAVRVKPEYIELTFSKYVERRSVEESIFISPYVGELKFDWSGTSVSIRFSQALRENTTYVVNVGTDVVDVGREGTRMASGFTLAFSTGDSIDHGMIRGRVFDAKPEGVMIFAYALKGLDPDTLNPSHTKPDYIMQTGVGGFFTLSNLALGTYRVLAVRDEYKNLLYDKEIDQFGVASGDVTLTAAAPTATGVWFRLSKEDTTKPFLSNVNAMDRFDLTVRFSEPLDTATFGGSSFSVIDTLSRRQIPVALSWIQRHLPASVGLMLSTPLDSGRTYRLSVAGVSDRAGNLLDTAHASADFTGVPRPDTLKPRYTVVALHDSARGYPPDASLEIDFSKPVRHRPIDQSLQFLDSSSHEVPAERQWLSPTDLLFKPLRELNSNAWYRFRIVMDSVVDERGNRYRDSVSLLRFQTLDLKTTGTLDGTIVDEKKGSAGEIVVTAASAAQGSPQQRTIRVPQPGPFSITQIVEGKYVLSAYRDADSSRSFSYGLPYPFKPSERFTVYPDTLKVRARWGVEGVVIKLR